MTDLKLVEQLAELCGISGNYEDWTGNPVSVATEYKLPLLQAMGLNVSSDEAIQRAIEQQQRQPWDPLIPPVCVFTQGHSLTIPLHLDSLLKGSSFKGKITLESGREVFITVDTTALAVEESRVFQNQNLSRLSFQLPDDLPLGYHQLSLQSDKTKSHCLLIIAPETCFEPGQLTHGGKIWGSAIQLYTVRTENDWGMGDFSSLRLLAQKLAAEGADIIGLNPIHALYPANPLHTSPYSPSSRNFINPLYIDITEVEDFAQSQEAQQRYVDKAFQGLLQQARTEEYVDYNLVATLKYGFLTLLFDHFNEHHIQQGSPRGQSFLNFCQNRGSELERHALYEAIYEHYKNLDINNWGWPCWEDTFQNPDSNAVKEFAEENEHRIQYYMYLQWVAEDQLAHAQNAAVESGNAGWYLQRSGSRG